MVIGVFANTGQIREAIERACASGEQIVYAPPTVGAGWVAVKRDLFVQSDVVVVRTEKSSEISWSILFGALRELIDDNLKGVYVVAAPTIEPVEELLKATSNWEPDASLIRARREAGRLVIAAESTFDAQGFKKYIRALMRDVA